jgi:predicted GIY-YIG superfamily endonuclease
MITEEEINELRFILPICYVYGLYETNDLNKEIKYIGVTINPIQRLKQHLKLYIYSNDEKDIWIKNNQNNISMMFFAENISVFDASNLERELIKSYGKKHYLFNKDAGSYKLTNSQLINYQKKILKINQVSSKL